MALPLLIYLALIYLTAPASLGPFDKFGLILLGTVVWWIRGLYLESRRKFHSDRVIAALKLYQPNQGTPGDRDT